MKWPEFLASLWRPWTIAEPRSSKDGDSAAFSHQCYARKQDPVHCNMQTPTRLTMRVKELTCHP
jgi:hypothetical protein